MPATGTVQTGSSFKVQVLRRGKRKPRQRSQGLWVWINCYHSKIVKEPAVDTGGHKSLPLMRAAFNNLFTAPVVKTAG